MRPSAIGRLEMPLQHLHLRDLLHLGILVQRIMQLPEDGPVAGSRLLPLTRRQRRAHHAQPATDNQVRIRGPLSQQERTARISPKQGSQVPEHVPEGLHHLLARLANHFEVLPRRDTRAPHKLGLGHVRGGRIQGKPVDHEAHVRGKGCVNVAVEAGVVCELW